MEKKLIPEIPILTEEISKDIFKKMLKNDFIEPFKPGPAKGSKGYKHSIEAKLKISKSWEGRINNAIDTIWINNSKINKRIKIENFESWETKGFKKGFLCKRWLN